jgi:hypothetical protein
MTDTHDLRVSARTAQLLASDGDGDDGPPWRFSGVAVAAGDILHMEDGTPVLFTEDELRKAAETQADEPLTKDHPEDDQGRPVYPPPTDETVGKVPKAGWLDDAEGVGYEATTHDEEIAQGVQAGSYDVSVHPTFELGAKDPETGAYIARNIQFRDLSVVSKGDSLSNTAEWGPSQALASLTADAIGDELTASADEGGTSDQESLVSSAVNGTLRALGLSPGDVDAERFSAEGGSTDNEGAESPADADSDSSSMDDDSRKQYRTFITAHSSLDEDDVAEMGDGLLEQTHEIVAEAATDGGDGGSTSDADDDHDDDPSDDDDRTIADMTVDELGSALRDQGFVTEDNVDDLTEQVTAQQTKGEKVDAIIANSDDYEEGDREDLMASADKVVDREHERVTGTPGSQLPGAAGLAASATPTGSDSTDDEDVDAYGTGVADH